MNRRIIAFFLSLQLALATNAFASASILGFSVGEDNLTLSALLSQAMQQVQFLSDIANATHAVRDDIAFIKDAYGTANDIANGNWQAIEQDLLDTIINSDSRLQQIYSDTQQIISNRVPQGDSFRRLLAMGFSSFLLDAFGPYPFGNRGQVYAYTDYRALSMDKMVADQEAALKQKHKAMQDAWQQCQKNPGACERAQAALQLQNGQTMIELQTMQNQRARLEEQRALIESGEKRQHENGVQQDLSKIADSMHVLTGSPPSPSTAASTTTQSSTTPGAPTP